MDRTPGGAVSRFVAGRGRVVVAGAIVAVVLAAVVGLVFGQRSGVEGAAPGVSVTESAAPSVSNPAGAPTASGDGSATQPAATDLPVRPPILASGPVASVSPDGSPGGGPSASGTNAQAPVSPSGSGSAAPEGKRFDSKGGFVYAVCDQGKARLTYWEANPGFTVEKVASGPALTAEIIFKGSPTRYRTTVTCVAGIPTPVLLPL